MFKKIVFFSFCLAMLVSCKNDENVKPERDILNFGNLELGKKLDFLMFTTSCDDFNGSFQLTGDTLAWSVDMVSADSILLKEAFTDGSPLAQDREPVLVKVTEANPDRIIMPNRWSSNLFFFYGNDTLRVNPTHTVELSQEDCAFKLGEDVFRGDEIAFINALNIEDYSFDNMTIVSCVPGSVGDAYIIYNNGNIKAIFSRDFFSSDVRGFIALD